MKTPRLFPRRGRTYARATGIKGWIRHGGNTHDETTTQKPEADAHVCAVVETAPEHEAVGGGDLQDARDSVEG